MGVSMKRIINYLAEEEQMEQAKREPQKRLQARKTGKQ